MNLCQPSSLELRRQRDHLLQNSMRPAGLFFSITEEYPIVLGAGSEFSYCLVDDDPGRLQYYDVCFGCTASFALFD